VPISVCYFLHVERVPDLELDEVGDLSLVSAGLPSSSEVLRKDNLPSPDRFKRYTEEREKEFGERVRWMFERRR